MAHQMLPSSCFPGWWGERGTDQQLGCTLCSVSSSLISLGSLEPERPPALQLTLVAARQLPDDAAVACRHAPVSRDWLITSPRQFSS